MKKRKFPLFIIDTSRSHGRGEETDYIACTSKELPFIAEVTIISDGEYTLTYDKTDVLTVYSEANGAGFRLKVHVVDVDIRSDKEVTPLRALLKRAIGEIMLRRKTVTYNPDNVSDEAAAKLMEGFVEQCTEGIRSNGEDAVVQRNILPILLKIKKDYDNRNK